MRQRHNSIALLWTFLTSTVLLTGTVTLLVGTVTPSAANAQEVGNVEFGFLNPPAYVRGEAGSTVEFDVFASVRVLDTEKPGFTGMVMAALTDGAEVVAISTEDLTIDGSPVQQQGAFFYITDFLADPTDPNRKGALLVFDSPGYPGPSRIMSPAEPEAALRITLSVVIPEGDDCHTVHLGFEDGLQGRGSPATNAIVLQGEAFTPETTSFEVCVTSQPVDFQRGDANSDGQSDISDPIFILWYLFTDTVETRCEDAADANDDGVLNITDVVYLFDYRFRGGPPPPAPHGPCGMDPSEDTLSCVDFAPCAAGV